VEVRVRDVSGKGIPVMFGPISKPDEYKIDFLKVARDSLSIGAVNFNECTVEIGDRLGEEPYSEIGRAKKGMRPTYLYEGSVWVNFYSPDGKTANVSLVPHLDKTGHLPAINPHHAFWIYSTDFNGRENSTDKINGHIISTKEPVVVSMTLGNETRKGTIPIRS
jgi:hypothetical protein